MGNRPTTYFNKEGWANITKGFKEKTGKNYDKVQFKNKWDFLKREWKLWKELKRGSTGLGWDPRKKTIDASEEWWKEKLEVVPLAKKFKLAGIDPELEEKMDLMFDGVVATGSNLCATTVAEVREDSVNLSSESDPDFVSKPECSRSKRPSSSNMKSNTSRKRGSSTLTAEVTRLITAVGNIGASAPIFTSPIAPSISTNTTSFSCFDAIRVIEELEEVKGDPAFLMHSIRLMANEVVREMFMAVSPGNRVLFLRDYFEHP